MICLAEQPLHAVPLLKFHSRSPSNLVVYNIPQWINHSYYSQLSDKSSALFIPRMQVPSHPYGKDKETGELLPKPGKVGWFGVLCSIKSMCFIRVPMINTLQLVPGLTWDPKGVKHIFKGFIYTYLERAFRGIADAKEKYSLGTVSSRRLVLY